MTKKWRVMQKIADRFNLSGSFSFENGHLSKQPEVFQIIRTGYVEHGLTVAIVHILRSRSHSWIIVFFSSTSEKNAEFILAHERVPIGENLATGIICVLFGHIALYP